MASFLCFSIVALASAAEPCLSWCGEWTCSYADCAGCPKSSCHHYPEEEEDDDDEEEVPLAVAAWEPSLRCRVSG